MTRSQVKKEVLASLLFFATHDEALRKQLTREIRISIGAPYACITTVLDDLYAEACQALTGDA